jgi:hypothetical protein
VYPYEKPITLEGSPVPPSLFHTYILNARFEDVVVFLYTCITSRLLDFYDPHMHSHGPSSEVSFEFTTRSNIENLKHFLDAHFPYLTDVLVEVTGPQLD